MIGTIIILALLVGETSCGRPYLFPFEPFNKNAQKDAIIITNNAKYKMDKGDKDEKNN